MIKKEETSSNVLIELLISRLTDNIKDVQVRPEIFGDTVLLASNELKIAIDIIQLEKRASDIVGKNYHFEQQQKFQTKGWKLIQIFEDELVSRFECVLSRVLHALHKTTIIIYARKCTVKSLVAKEARAFLDIHHLQGAGAGAGIYVGLLHEELLVAVMSLGKARFSKSASHELIRFASHMGCNIPGGAAKLLKAAVDIIGTGNKLVSYADARYGDGGTYTKIGFTKSLFSSPCYWYFEPGKLKRHHRSAFQKHKLIKVLKDFDPAKTEIVNMAINGWLRVFDSGNNVFTLDT